MTAQSDPADTSPPLEPAALGFHGNEKPGWTLQIRDREVQFRLLRTRDDLVDAERLQQDVFGVSERDLIPANELIVVPETGGAVIAAFLSEQPERAAAVLVGWGGFVRRPRMVSDFLAVQPEARNLGLAFALKRLQAAIALQRGFAEIVWTVDPLRAANARLNFGKLGAVATAYEVDRYGTGFAPGLYGGIPTDRLHVTWEIASPRVIHCLLGDGAPSLPRDPILAALSQRDETILIEIPSDIDALLAEDPAAALAWRLRLREELIQAFANRFAIVGFWPASGEANPSLVLAQDWKSSP